MFCLEYFKYIANDSDYITCKILFQTVIDNGYVHQTTNWIQIFIFSPLLIACSADGYGLFQGHFKACIHVVDLFQVMFQYAARHYPLRIELASLDLSNEGDVDIVG